ncbi:hypothetical protein AQB9606_04486 [Aquabacterium sp. CECT 9606]|nr:hypothetical protein AQB9606_04486 [Aquabacterium sp. CECT 9606]
MHASLTLRQQGRHQCIERQVLVGLGAQHRFTHLGQPIRKSEARVHLGTQHLHIGHIAHQAMGFGAQAVGGWRADADVGLPRQAVQGQPEQGQHHHVKRGALRLGHLAQLSAQLGRQGLHESAFGRMAHGLAWAVQWQVQHGVQAAQAGLPIGQLPVLLTRLHPVALPHGIVRVADRQGCQAGRLAQGVGLVQGQQLVHQDAQRPGVGRDVVDHDGQQVFGIADPEQRRAPGRLRVELEGLLREGLGLLAGHRFTHRHGRWAQIAVAQNHLGIGQDALPGLALCVGHEDCAQHLVAPRQIAHAAAQRCLVQRPAQVQQTGHVVGGAGLVQLPGQPQAALCHRQRQVISGFALQPHDGQLGEVQPSGLHPGQEGTA